MEPNRFLTPYAWSIPLGGNSMSRIRSFNGQRQRGLATFGAQSLAAELSETEVTSYQHKQAQLQEQIEHLGQQIEQLKQQRKQTPHHVKVAELPEAERFQRLLPERKQFLDTIKLISYRAETSMASVLRETLTRSDDTRARAPANLQHRSRPISRCRGQNLDGLSPPPHPGGTRPSAPPSLRRTQRHRDDFPGTDLRLIYKIGSMLISF